MSWDTYYYGTDDKYFCADDICDWQGLCLTDDIDIAREYGEHVFAVNVPMGRLTVEDLDADGACGWYPGDDDVEEYSDRGVDVITYADQSRNYNTGHTTWRLCSERAHDMARATLCRIS